MEPLVELANSASQTSPGAPPAQVSWWMGAVWEDSSGQGREQTGEDGSQWEKCMPDPTPISQPTLSPFSYQILAREIAIMGPGGPEHN